MPNNIPDAAKKVPLMFQAQTKGRCQIQYIDDQARKEKRSQQAERWAEQWIDKAYPNPPIFGDQVQTRSYSISWRFVTNSGQDDGVIRPVIGARGWPFYPGSSMKGIFRRACTIEQAQCYCGKDIKPGDFQPGILRFHGGYPTSDTWQENLVDIVHPQQDWQVKDDKKSAGAFVQISLYKPELIFGISSTIPQEAKEWETIWNIWEKALSTGIGCRVSAGYGQPQQHTGELIYRIQIQGQGQASKLLNGSGEFRPNIFRAALRGHALRIFGGLTDADTADRLVETLFGGVRSHQEKFGLLSMTFRETDLELEEFGQRSYTTPTYKVKGYLTWLLTQNLGDTEREALQKLVKALTRFAMLLGGFGKSWRRADHRLFLPEYYDQEDPKPLIGCHWEWLGTKSLIQDVRVRKLEQVSQFIEEVRQAAANWMQLQGITPDRHNYAPWREAWHPETVQVWGRLADEAEDCEAIRWLHSPYREAIPRAKISEGSIYCSSVTGKVGQIGKLWHRMYPVVRLLQDPKKPNQPMPKKTNQYLELLTFFPDDSDQSEQFLEFLESHPKKILQKLWGN